MVFPGRGSTAFEGFIRMNRRTFLGMMTALGAVSAFPTLLHAGEQRLPKGMVTFVFDDGIVTNHSYSLPILKKRGQVATAGLVVNRLLSGNSDYMSVDQAKELEQGGWEIASHSMTHSRPVQIPKTLEQEVITGWRLDETDPDHYQAQYDYDRVASLFQDGKPLKVVENLEQLRATPGSYWLDLAISELHVHPLRSGDPATLGIRAGSYQREMEDSKKILTELGFKVDTYIAPHNYWTDDVEAISRRYYQRACTGRDSDNRPATFDAFAIKRFMVHTKDSAQQLIRIIRDHALEYGAWVVFCFHGVGEDIGWEPYPADAMDAVSAFVDEQKIPLVTVRAGCAVISELRKQQPVAQSKSIVKKGS